MKAYEITVQGEKEWVIARTAIEALQVYKHITDKLMNLFNPPQKPMEQIKPSEATELTLK